MRRSWRTIPIKEREAIIADLKARMPIPNWREEQRRFGIDHDTLRYQVDDDFRHKLCRLQIVNRKKRPRHGATNHLAERGPTAADLAARRAEIPPDVRSVTGVAFGDPLPGRSALERRRKGAA